MVSVGNCIGIYRCWYHYAHSSQRILFFVRYAGKYAGGNPARPRDTPDWQKGICAFFSRQLQSHNETDQQSSKKDLEPEKVLESEVDQESDEVQVYEVDQESEEVQEPVAGPSHFGSSSTDSAASQPVSSTGYSTASSSQPSTPW